MVQRLRQAPALTRTAAGERWYNENRPTPAEVAVFDRLKHPPRSDIAPGGPPAGGPNLKPDQFALGDGSIVADLTKKQLTLLGCLKQAGAGGIGESGLCRHLEYRDDSKGRKSLAQLARRTNEKLNDHFHLIELLNGHYCLTRTAA